MHRTNPRNKQLRKIKEEVVNLKSSPLFEYRTKHNYFPVIGEGNHCAKIMFIGEAPGETEARTGRPFCGAAGRVLDQLLASISLDRKDVYITNIVKDRPPSNRDPKPEEIECYAPFLVRQIDIIKPKIIATLGRFSTKFILELFGLGDQLKPISQIHGKTFKTLISSRSLFIIPLYHPAVALYTSSMKPILEKDFATITSLLP